MKPKKRPVIAFQAGLLTTIVFISLAWSASSFGYFWMLPILDADIGYNDAPVFYSLVLFALLRRLGGVGDLDVSPAFRPLVSAVPALAKPIGILFLQILIAAQISLLVPRLLLHTPSGFTISYGIHWGFYAVDAAVGHFVFG